MDLAHHRRMGRPRLARKNFRSGGLALGAWLLAVAVQAQPGSPTQRLTAAAPEVFVAAAVAEGAELGVAGARVLTPTQAMQDLGLLSGDLVIGIDGRMLAADDWQAPADQADLTLTVVRRVPGERPRLPPAVLARQTLDEWCALPAPQRSPMRLARMLANQQRLVQDGVGFLLLPAARNQDDAAWSTFATPMPGPWELALQEMRAAIFARTALPAVEGSEAEAASRLLAQHEYLEAHERAQRAIIDHVSMPEKRAQRQAFDELVAVYLQAMRGLEGERREALDPGSRFAIVLEPMFSSSTAPLSQDIFFNVDRSNDFQIAVGWNTSLHWPSPDGGWPVLRDLDLLVEYANTLRSYDGPHGEDELPVGQGVEPPVTERMSLTDHRISFELTYRPSLRSRLRPMLRGGPALFMATADAIDENGVVRDQEDMMTWGWVVGGGIDIFHHRTSGFRTSVVGSYQIVTHEFCTGEVPPNFMTHFITRWESASNIREDQFTELEQSLCVEDGSVGYELRLDAWQVGLMLAYDF